MPGLSGQRRCSEPAAFPAHGVPRMWRHRPCDADAARTTHSKSEGETSGPSSVAGSQLERLGIATLRQGIARELRKHVAILEREIADLEPGLTVTSHAEFAKCSSKLSCECLKCLAHTAPQLRCAITQALDFADRLIERALSNIFIPVFRLAVRHRSELSGLACLEIHVPRVMNKARTTIRNCITIGHKFASWFKYGFLG